MDKTALLGSTTTKFYIGSTLEHITICIVKYMAGFLPSQVLLLPSAEKRGMIIVYMIYVNSRGSGLCWEEQPDISKVFSDYRLSQNTWMSIQSTYGMKRWPHSQSRVCQCGGGYTALFWATFAGVDYFIFPTTIWLLYNGIFIVQAMLHHIVSHHWTNLITYGQHINPAQNMKANYNFSLYSSKEEKARERERSCCGHRIWSIHNILSLAYPNGIVNYFIWQASLVKSGTP